MNYYYIKCVNYGINKWYQQFYCSLFFIYVLFALLNTEFNLQIFTFNIFNYEIYIFMVNFLINRKYNIYNTEKNNYIEWYTSLEFWAELPLLYSYFPFIIYKFILIMMIIYTNVVISRLIEYMIILNEIV